MLIDEPVIINAYFDNLLAMANEPLDIEHPHQLTAKYDDNTTVNQDSGYHSLTSADFLEPRQPTGSKNKQFVQRNILQPPASENQEMHFRSGCPECQCTRDNYNDCGYHHNNNNGAMTTDNNFEQNDNRIHRQCVGYKNHHEQVFPIANVAYNNLQKFRIPEQSMNNNNHKINKENISDENEELELKIEFCLKFGFSIDQIRLALNQIGHNAIKDDILSYLCSTKNNMLNSISESLLSKEEDNLRSRGPSTVDDAKTKMSKLLDDSKDLRPIVIDGSNVAMSHGGKEYFSCKGIQIAVDYFWDRNHRDITVFVPKYRQEPTRPDAPIKDQSILKKLEKDKILVYTPSRNIGGKRVACYDDRFILQLALETEGVIVSNDLFRDLQDENPDWKELINKRLLMYSFVNDRFMLPDDPLGRNGPSLDNLLRKRPICDDKQKTQKCPYGKKCTYGRKCKFFHPENSHLRSVTEKLKESTRKRLQPSQDAKNLAAELVQSDSGKPTTATVPKDDEMKASNAAAMTPERRSSPQKQDPHERFNRMQDAMHSLSVKDKNQHYFANNSLPEQHGKFTYAEVRQTPTVIEGRPLMPPLHNAQRGIVASSTSPQQRQIQQQHINNMYHSSPPAIPAYDMQPQKEMLQMHTHPAATYPQSYQPFPHPYQMYQMPQAQCMTPHQNMLLLQSQVQAQNFNQQFYQQQAAARLGHSQDARHPQSMGMQGSGSPNPTAYNRQVYSSPNPQQIPVCLNPQSLSNGQMSAGQICHPAQPHMPNQSFKDPSDSRYHIYRNLCGLFPRATVERVLSVYQDETDPPKLAKLCLES